MKLIMRLENYLFYALAIGFGALVVIESFESDRLLRLAAEMQSLAGSTRMAWAALLERLSLSWYSGATELAEAYARIVAQAGVAGQRAQLWAGLVGVLALAHLAVVAFRPPRSRARLAWHLNLLAVVALVIGILAPMLTVIAHASVPVLGEVILRYATKSILSTVRDLAQSGNLLLAVAIALFSMVLPVIKLVLLITALGAPLATQRAHSITLLNAVGKWSMADVFVVAVLVAFLALDKDANSTARIGLGLYFFGAYCLLSMGASHLAAHPRVAQVSRGVAT